MIFTLIFLFSFQMITSNQIIIPFQKPTCVQDIVYNEEVSSALDQMNKELLCLRRIQANVKWDLATKSSAKSVKLNSAISGLQSDWRKEWCSKFRNLTIFQCSHEEIIHFLCRGPIYASNISKKLAVIEKKLSQAYSETRICKTINREESRCFHSEPDLEKLMTTSRNESELRWIWKSWQNKMSHLKNTFIEFVNLQNLGARSNDYHDIGEYWREEFEISNLKEFVIKLYDEIAPLYKLLHGFVRYKLIKVYPEIIHPKRPIFSHLLGNLWSQNWSPLIKHLLPNADLFNITEQMLEKNYTVREMVRKAEDFYLSLGFPRLSKTFWEKSIFERRNDTMNCHASAADMYTDDDFRILACLQVDVEDFQVVFHEMGHIQYYMAYASQPTIFRGAPNSAFHEAIGDTILLGAMAPQNLQRLGLVKDSFLADNIPILLKQALSKLPLLIHSLIMDLWRWEVFSGKINSSSYNRSWWKLYKKYMGIEPPIRRSEIHFDPASVFYITENVPSSRYFLSSILQFQLFDSICQASIMGKIDHSNFKMPLHQCDIYGSKEAGRRLRSLMQLGSSINWNTALYLITESTKYETKFLLNYYEPLEKWLQSKIDRYNIPLGWD